MLWKIVAPCLALSLGLLGCATNETKGRAIPKNDIYVIGPAWNDTLLPEMEAKQRVNVTLGTKGYHAEYGGEPSISGDTAQPSIVGMGDTWSQSRGYFYLWGYWRLLESDRIDAITWGTTVIWRWKAGREQLFVECGDVLVMPKGVEQCVIVKAGNYVDITLGITGEVVVSEPMPTPQPADNPADPELKEIKAFLDKARQGHSDPCNP